MKVILRKFNPVIDSGLIYSSYPKGVYYGSYVKINPEDYITIKNSWFKQFYKSLQDQLNNSTITIACMSDAPETILGYSIVTGTILNFIYVKEVFRNQGIGRLLFKCQQQAIEIRI